MTPILISFLHDFPGAVPAECALCDNIIYEHQANLDRVTQMRGWIICVMCALQLKVSDPSLFPEVEAQLWEGHLRQPEPAAGNEWMLRVFNKNH